MFVEYHVPDSKPVIRNLVYKLMLRVDASCKKLVIAIINSDMKWQSRTRRHRIKLLYIHNSFWLNVPLCNIILLPCAILLYFLVTYISKVYVDISMIIWNKDRYWIELNVVDWCRTDLLVRWQKFVCCRGMAATRQQPTRGACWWR